VTEAESIGLELLAYHYKSVNQRALRPGLTYDPDLPPIDYQLSEWILQEMQYLEKKRTLASRPTVGMEPQKEFKLEFDMSVSQFACFVKSFIEAGIIQNKNISEVIRFFAKFVKTKRSENISNESFRMKYYNVESSTKDSVKNLLHNAIAYINSN
jgi:hypothetical protein